MGGLKAPLKTTYTTFLIACIAIAGIPPLSGFFSKDEIMMFVFSHGSLGKVIWVVGMLAALMTAYYMFRLLFITFFGEFRGTEHQKEHLHESPALMTVPLIVLAVLSIVGGFIGVPKVLGGNHALDNLLRPLYVASGEEVHLAHETEYILMAIAVLIGVAGIFIAWMEFKKYDSKQESKGLYNFFENKWYFDELYDAIVSKPLKKLSVFFDNIIEKSGIDGFVNGVGKFVQISSDKLRLLQSGLVGFYLFLMVIGIILLFIIQLMFNNLN